MQRSCGSRLPVTHLVLDDVAVPDGRCPLQADGGGVDGAAVHSAGRWHQEALRDAKRVSHLDLLLAGVHGHFIVGVVF